MPRRSLFAPAVAGVAFCAPLCPAQWTQWGGPQRDFQIAAPARLVENWGEDGPKVLWKRALGAGYSAILVDGDRLYTMMRRGDDDVVLCLKAADGETIWERPYSAPPKPDMQLEFGPGPHSTPVLTADRLFCVSATVILNAVEKSSGKILWTKDLMAELGASHMGRGYGPSPLIYRDLLILPVGGKQTGVAAFKQDSGELVWKTPPMRGCQASPRIVRIHDEDHLVASMGTDRLALDPATGEIRWSIKADDQSAAIMASPCFIAPDYVFFSAAYGGGSDLIKVLRDGGKYSAEVTWHSAKMKVHHQTIVSRNGYVYGSSGDFGPAFLAAVELETGKVTGRLRDFAKCNLLLAGDKLIVLDEEGWLALAKPESDGINVVSKAKLLQDKAWTVPTLVGTKLYLRDTHDIMAVDLGAEG
ncbi:outer membrane biogenesis protein BamB [Phycisphaerae bacterium RAS1]|nr:outer membrane biogenesis protein BamB [Phycisphaerae bacterium RAS1]